MLTRPSAFFILIALAGLPAQAAPDPEVREALRHERYTLTEVKKQLWKLARAASKAGNDEEARRQLQLGKEVDPADVKLHKQWIKLLTRTGEAQLDDAYERRRAAVHEDCGELLADAALKFKAARQAKRARHYRDLVARRFPSKVAAKKLGLEYYSPYLRWVPESAARRLREGWEEHENRWVKPDEVLRLNGLHSTIDNPWVLYSEGFRLTTNLNLRAARRFLAYAEAYRRWFLDRFDGRGWNLKVPRTVLPVIVAKRFTEFEAQYSKIRPGRRGGWTDRVMPSGLYCYSVRQAPSPCLMSLELSPQEKANYAKKGRKVPKTTVRRLLPVLTHELSHQFSFEYSRHLLPKRPNNWGPGHWVVEGFATFLGAHVFDGKRWSLSGSKRISPILRSLRGRVKHLPELAELFVMNQKQFQDPAWRGENYRMAGAAVLFLIYGAKGKHRASLYKLLDSVHGGKTGMAVFGDCFPDVDLDALNKEWLAFLTADTIPIGDGRALRFKATAKTTAPRTPGGSGQ